MTVTNEQIQWIAQQVRERLDTEESVKAPFKGVYPSIQEAVEAAFKAQKVFLNSPLAFRKKLIEAMRAGLASHVEELAALGVEETGMGRVADKVLKHRAVIEKTPGVEDLMSGVFTGDDGLTLLEYAPFGVIGAIAPSTNPSETVICNAIGMIAAGNAVVFCPHPNAKKTSNLAVHYLNVAIQSVGGPEGLVNSVDQPNMAAVDALMHHDKVQMLCATGGPGVVKAVLSSGKKAIGAGAGNPPVLVDETADIENAALAIVNGCTFDNNLPCIAEKEALVVDDVCDYLIFNMKKHGAFEIKDAATLQKLEALVLDDAGHLNRAYVGKDASVILKAIGIDAGADIRLIIAETAADHPFAVEELMMPILPIVRVRDAAEGIDLACKLEHGLRHTAVCHSKNIDVLTEMAHRIQTTIFVKNGPSYAGIGVGGEGFTTFTIAGPTGEGLTSAKAFTRRRRCVLVGGFNIK